MATIRPFLFKGAGASGWSVPYFPLYYRLRDLLLEFSREALNCDGVNAYRRSG